MSNESYLDEMCVVMTDLVEGGGGGGGESSASTPGGSCDLPEECLSDHHDILNIISYGKMSKVQYYTCYPNNNIGCPYIFKLL